jgi:hypothetical protein
VTEALLSCVSALAVDVGRWTRYVTCNDTYAAVLVERICVRVDTLDGIVRPPAADLYRANLERGLDDDDAAREALAETDRGSDTPRRTLGLDEDGHLPAPKRPPTRLDHKQA